MLDLCGIVLGVKATCCVLNIFERDVFHVIDNPSFLTHGICFFETGKDMHGQGFFVSSLKF